MWWLDPGKEVLNVVFNRILAPYVENLDMNQVNYGIAQGQLTLRNLRLKKGALDKFRLPVDVSEGYLGKFTLSLHWMNLGNQPVEILIEDVYLLVVPTSQSKVDPEEEEQRAQAAKAERLDNAELLHMRGQAEANEDEPHTQGLWESLTAKIINNLQITVRHIHVRYEDKLSVPGHPFAAGLTLAGFTAVSVNSKWQPAFIESTAGSIHKLANLQSLAVYFDTDSASLAGLPPSEAIKRFTETISDGHDDSDHQFILKPVSGEGRIIMNHKVTNLTPRFDVQLLFDEIGVVLDDKQYRDAISFIDMYHVYARQRQYRKFRPSDEEFSANRAKAWLMFAGTAILEGVRQRRRKWTWAYFAERRDDRNSYVDLFQRKVLNTLTNNDLEMLQTLERKLSYEDLRFYRSITRSRLRKDAALRKKLEEDKKRQAPAQSWTSWLWGSPKDESRSEDPTFGGPMTAEQRKQLYDVLDFDEKAALAESLQPPRDSLKTRVTAKLDKGSFSLKVDPHGNSKDILAVVFETFQATFIQRPDNLEASVSLQGLGVFDGTTDNTVYPQIVQVKVSEKGTNQDAPDKEQVEPFFYIKFENNPLDERADSALIVRLRHMEIIYHKGYIEAVYKFLKPPASQLESVEALLNVASQTLEGLRKETRAGLEHALQIHKTIDIQMDMNSPIIIIPEDITTESCKHLVIDAGHIAIESELADKTIIRSLRLKQGSRYNEADVQQLEALMYDKLTLRLEAAQFLIGDDLQSCRNALTTTSGDTLHLLERTSIDLQIQNSIVPAASTLSRIKVSGTLPALQLNISDAKYRSILRLIDVCIPKFEDSKPTQISLPVQVTNGPRFSLPTGLFSESHTEYNVDDEVEEDVEEDHAGTNQRAEQFFEAEDNSIDPELKQHIFELNFTVANLGATLSKSNGSGIEKPLGKLSFQHFALTFALAKYDMRVNVNLRSLTMELNQLGAEPIKFISSTDGEAAQGKDLMSITYSRVQQDSPEFNTVYEGIDQNVDIRLSTFIFRAAPEPVITLYDFIMSTFVQETTRTVAGQQGGQNNDISVAKSAPSSNNQKIRVLVKLASVDVLFMHDVSAIVVLSLSTADISVLLRANTMRITGRLGNLALSHDSDTQGILPEFKQILSIEGQNFAEFRYQTFDPNDELYSGMKSAISLTAGSLKFNFLEEPLHNLYLFTAQLAKLKGLYDAATQAAVQKASEIELMHFEVSIKSPIAVFPSDPVQTKDVLIMRLGEISAYNTCEAAVNKISAGLRGIQLTSRLYHQNEMSILKIIDDVDVLADIIQTSGIDRNRDGDYPDTQIAVQISDIRLHLTQVQYGLLLCLTQSVPRVFAGVSDSKGKTEQLPNRSLETNCEAMIALEPELRKVSATGDNRSWTAVDLVVAVNAIKLHLYDGLVTTSSNLKEHGIARFALNNNTLRLKLLSNGASQAQVVLKSFTMSNTRPGNSKFREIIPAARHNRDQFTLLYTMAGGPNATALAVLTVESPQIVFAVDPIFALIDFFTSALPSPAGNQSTIMQMDVSSTQPQSSLSFRVDLHDVSICVLENDDDPESQAVELRVKQVLMAQQGTTSVTVGQLGMSLTRMGRASENVRFLDDTDMTFIMDNRSTSSQRMMSIEITAKPIILRASYRDINLITSIANKAVTLYGNSQQRNARAVQSITAESFISSKPSHSQMDESQPIGKAKVLTSKEQLSTSFDGFHLVLIGDMHEQPMLHLRVKPFIIGARDWSAEVHATTTIALHINYWNLTNSHWEPLIDPWTFTLSVNKESATNGLQLALTSRERLDLNLTTSFVEQTITTISAWGREGSNVLNKARGSYAPYRIKNRTGSTICIWADADGTVDTKDVSVMQIAPEQIVDWRFDDWKKTREHVSSTGQNNIGIRVVGSGWEDLRSVPVHREGEYTFSLRSRTERFSHRLLCEVAVEDTVKVVTIRSTYKVENRTLYPLEIMLVDETGHPVSSLEKVAPGYDYSLPIESVMRNRIRIQPDQGFGYKWCPPIRFEDLIARRSFTIKCPHTDPKEDAFRFQAWSQTDVSDTPVRKIPKINLKLRAPIELENLLPYNLEYRIYDKDTDQNWRSYLRMGGIMPVHSVELGHLVLLNIAVQDAAFKPSDFAIISTDGQSDFDIENQLSLRDAQDRRLDLKLNYVRYPDSGGAFKVQVYSRYLVINKSGLPFWVRSIKTNRTSSPQDVAGDLRPDVISNPLPFMLSHSQSHGHEFTFKIGDSTWSKVVSFEAPAADMALVIPSRKIKSEEIHIGLSWAEGQGKYKLTKAISFREHGVAPRERSLLNPGERCHLHFIRSSAEKLLTVAFPGLNTHWSPPINIEDIGVMHFRMRRPGNNDQLQLVRAEVKVDGATIFIYFGPATEGWPFEIENDSDYSFSISQTDEMRSDRDGSRSGTVYNLNAHSRVSYAWDYPAARDKKLLLTAFGSHRIVDIMEIGDLMPFKFTDSRRHRAVSLDVRADNHKQVLHITNYNPNFSHYRPKHRNSTRQDSIASTAETFEAVTEEVTPTLAFQLEFAGIGISLVNRKLIEVLYVSANTLKFEYSESPIAQAINLSCGTLQIDNQLHDALYPVTLQPTPIGKESKGVAPLPTVQGSVIWLKDRDHGVLFVKYCSILLQALTIEADEDLLFSIYDLTQIKGASWEEDPASTLVQNLEIPEPQETPTGQDVYFEVLELQPIKLSLSFMRTERVNSDEKLNIRNPLAVVVNALTMTVGNINDAPLEMNALAIKDMRLTFPELLTRITYHYRQDVLRQLYRILGSADFIGNPVGLFTNVSSGVADIFYEPFNGVVMHGNKELGIGIAKGAASFVKKTVFGLSDSFTKFTSSVGKGLSAATFDSEYQARRRMTQRRNRPRHAIYGVATGGEALATSVASAMEGVLMKPIEGAESEGAVGFFKGVGKGLVGAVTKPVIGVFDLASNVSEGIRNTTTVFDNPARDRVRLPRHVPADGVLRPYSARESLGQYWMRDLENGAYRREAYVAHINIHGGDAVVLLTASRILAFRSNKLKLDWDLPLTQIEGVTVEDTGIKFAHKGGREHDKFMFIRDKDSQSWFFGEVASVVKSFNVRRRMNA